MALKEVGSKAQNGSIWLGICTSGRKGPVNVVLYKWQAGPCERGTEPSATKNIFGFLD